MSCVLNCVTGCCFFGCRLERCVFIAGYRLHLVLSASHLPPSPVDDDQYLNAELPLVLHSDWLFDAGSSRQIATVFVRCLGLSSIKVFLQLPWVVDLYVYFYEFF